MCLTTRSDLGVQFLDLVTLLQRPSVRAQTSLGELVHALLGGRTTGLEHVQQSLLVGGKTHDLTNQLADELRALGDSLLIDRMRCIRNIKYSPLIF